MQSDDARDLRFQSEQIFLFVRLSHASLMGSYGAGLFVCYLVREHSPYRVAIWFALMALITSARILFQKRILSGRIEATRKLTASLLVMVAINGFVWSLPSTWLMPSEPTDQVMLSLFMVGISATSLTSLASMRHCITLAHRRSRLASASTMVK